MAKLLSFNEAAALAALGLASVACSSSDPASSIPIPGNQLTSTDVPVEFTDPKGNRWVRGERISAYEPEVPRGRLVHEGAPPPRRPVQDMSDEELARELWPHSSHGGYVYRWAAPPLEMARQVKANAGKVGEPRPGSPANAPVTGVDVPEDLRGQVFVSGADNRTYFSNTTSWPASTHILLGDNTDPVNNGGSACSATLIGRSTAVSSAHCFANGGGGFFGPRSWAPGVDRNDANPYPFGIFQPCYWVTVPGGWLSSGDATYDYAVIEFGPGFPTCGINIGDSTGWLGWWPRPPDGSVSGRTNYIYGYPGSPPASPGWPSLWGSGRCCDLSASGTDEYHHYIDASPGNSGSGHYFIYSDGGRYVVGTWRACRSVWLGGTYNVTRRMDGSFEALIVNNSNL